MQDDRPNRPHRSARAHNINARLESLRSILTNAEHYTTEQQEVALQAIANERRDRERQEQERRASQPSANARHMDDEGVFESQPSASPSSIVRTRRQMFSARERLARQRDRVDRLARQDPLERVSSNPSSLIPSGNSRPRSPSTDLDIEPPLTRDGGRSKRRKLDDGSSEDHTLPVYGLEGTLLAGSLKMKVLDYPRPEDPLPPADELAKSRLYQADNKDVFRTKKHKCTILMKHQGGWPFSLSRLVIRIPKHDYRDDTSPLQGMVFVSMNQDTLLERTSYYDTLFPAGYVLHRARRYDTHRPSHDYMHSTRSPMHSHIRPRQSPDPSDSQWCDPAHSIDDSITLPHLSGISITIDRLPADPETNSAVTSPRSPRPWHDPDYDYASRRNPYTDSYRPSYTSTSASTLTPHQAAERARRWRYAATQADMIDADPAISESPSPSDSASDDEETLLYRDVPSAQRELEEAEFRQRSFPEQTRARRESGRAERSDAYLYANLARFGGGGDPVADEDDRRLPPYTSTKRLPGCSEMLRGRRADSDIEADDTNSPLPPHATFQVTRDAGGGVVVNFGPEV